MCIILLWNDKEAQKEMATKLSDKYLKGFVSEHEYEAMAPQVKLAHNALHTGDCLGNDFIGWLTLPTDYDKEEFARIKAAAEKLRRILMYLSLSVLVVLTLVQEQLLNF